SLGTVEQDASIHTASGLNDFAHRIHGAQGVRDVGHGDQLRLRSKQLFKFVQQKLARIVDWANSQIRTLLLAKNLPGDDIGMMLHGGDDDLVAAPNVGASPRLGHEVDTLGGSA